MNAPVESWHLIAAHAVIEELQRNPRVTLEQLDGKDVIAQALANMEMRFWGYLRELARQVQRSVKSGEDPEQNALLLMADDVLTQRLGAPRADPWRRPSSESIDELIAKSSLGTPEAVAIREQADPQLVKKVLHLVDSSTGLPSTNDSAKPGSKFGETVTLVFQMTEKGVHARVDGRGSDYYLFEPTTRRKALERMGELLGWYSRSSVMSAQKSAEEQKSINEVLHYADMLSSDLSGDAKKREGILYQLQQASRLLHARRLIKENPAPNRALELIGSCRRELGALRDADDGTDGTTRQVLGHAVSVISTLVAVVEALRKS